MIKEGKTYSILADHLGTPTEAYDADGNEVWSRTLDMNGEVIEETGNVGMVPFLFQGQYYDRETGLAYNRFRYYSPQMGMYVSQDPIGLAGRILNLYGYVDNTNAWNDIFGLSKIYRVRHYTSTSGIAGIKKDNKIIAKDQNSVFTVKPGGRMTKGSSKDIEKRLGIKPGKGRRYVEFDVNSEEVRVVNNPITGATEHILTGDVDLTNRNPSYN